MNQISIDRERCKSCGLCMQVCPKQILRLSATLNSKGYRPMEVTDAERCIGCCFCATICPDLAIRIRDGKERQTA